MDLQLIQKLLKAAGLKPAMQPEYWNRSSQAFYMAHPALREYLHDCIPIRDRRIGAVRLPGLENILAYNYYSHPGEILVGQFFSLATTGRGDSRDCGNDNVICLHLETGRVYWASHKRFRPKIEIPWDSTLPNTGLQSVLSKLEPIADSLEAFLVALLQGELEEKLKALELSTGLPVSKAELASHTPDYQLDPKLYRQISELVREAKVAEGIALCEAKLTALEPTPFHAILGRSLGSQREDLSNWMIKLWQQAREQGIAAHAEMFVSLNEFELNTARWEAEAMVRAWAESGLAVQQQPVCSAPDDDYLLCGLEDLQVAYDASCRKAELRLWRKAGSTAMFLVTLRWMELFQDAVTAFAAQLLAQEQVKLLCGVHDWDFYRIVVCEGGRQK